MRAARLGLLVSFTALAVLGRLAFVWAPNVALTYFVVALAGLAYGPSFGFTVGLAAMTLSNLLLTGLDPVAFVNAPAMGLLGLAAGFAGRRVDLARERAASRVLVAGAAAFAGVAATLAFSVLADSTTYLVFYAPAGAPPGAWGALVALGLAFNALPAAVNGVLFGAGLPAAAEALARSGHADFTRGA
ncbi:MAG TPA: ECF transporter S component [Candidatus Thermoplasmatota archaeon]|nr:ECF transporter S component [Candidatus Thermoplasmatota archaeon]